MAKRLKVRVRFIVPAGQVTPAPPVGSALGQYGLKIMDFCQRFNEQTKDMGNVMLPVIVSIYHNNTFDFVIKKPETTYLLKEAAGIAKGSGRPQAEKVGEITKKQLQEIAEYKLDQLNTRDIEKAMKVIQGTAKSMGIRVV